MVTYTCPRCNYTTDHKTKFTRHQNRKNKCKIINKNITNTDFVPGNPAGHPVGHPDDQPDDQKDDQKNRVIRMTAKSYPKNTPNEDVLLENVKSQYQNFNNLSCRYCNEMFTQKQNRWRHEKYRCSLNPNVIKNKKSVIDKDKITMKLLSYNETNRMFLTDDMISFCMKKQNRCIPEMIKLVHFNNKYPENNNIVIRNLKNCGHVMIFNGEDWVLNDKNEMMDKIIHDNEKFIHTKFLEWYDDKSKKNKYKIAIDKFEQYLEQSSNQDLIQSIKKELKLLCYNIKNKVNTKNSGYIVSEVIN